MDYNYCWSRGWMILDCFLSQRNFHELLIMRIININVQTNRNFTLLSPAYISPVSLALPIRALLHCWSNPERARAFPAIIHPLGSQVHETSGHTIIDGLDLWRLPTRHQHRLTPWWGLTLLDCKQQGVHPCGDLGQHPGNRQAGYLHLRLSFFAPQEEDRNFGKIQPKIPWIWRLHALGFRQWDLTSPYARLCFPNSSFGQWLILLGSSLSFLRLEIKTSRCKPLTPWKMGQCDLEIDDKKRPQDLLQRNHQQNQSSFQYQKY